MNVMKFGGTSVGSPERMKHVVSLVTRSDEPVFVVLSAMSGTTNSLVEISDCFYQRNAEAALDIIDTLEEKYMKHVDELYSTEAWREKTRMFLREKFEYLRTFADDIFTSYEEKCVVAQGEIMSTNMVTNYLLECGVKAVLLPALDFMRTDKNGEPDGPYIREHLSALMEVNRGCDIYMTQGFICRNSYGEIDNLQRGGSDYTASLVGEAVDAGEIQIWTDIDGMHNNDPRFVDKTAPIRQLNFEEATELAYFGAKILHPTCVQPAQRSGIPVRLLNTMEPEAEGTIVNDIVHAGNIKAVAAKDNMMTVTVKCPPTQLLARFTRQVFDLFETHQTSADIICSSQMNISVCMENNPRAAELVEDLKRIGTVTVNPDMCIISIVGDLNWESTSFESVVLNALKDIPLRTVAYGASNYNISVLVRKTDKQRALQSLSDVLFYNKQTVSQ